MYKNLLACRVPICGLMGPLSAVIGPCVDSYSCCIVPGLPTCHWRWDAPMGLKMGDPVGDPQDSPESEARPQRTVFGDATPSQNQLEHSENGVVHYGTSSCRPALMGPNRCTSSDVFTILLAVRAASGDNGWGRYTLATQAS